MLGTYGRRWLRRAGFKHRECQRQGLAAMRAVRAVLSQPGARGGPVTRVLLPPLLAPALDALFPEAGGAPAPAVLAEAFALWGGVLLGRDADGLGVPDPAVLRRLLAGGGAAGVEPPPGGPGASLLLAPRPVPEGRFAQGTAVLLYALCSASVLAAAAAVGADAAGAYAVDAAPALAVGRALFGAGANPSGAPSAFGAAQGLGHARTWLFRLLGRPAASMEVDQAYQRATAPAGPEVRGCGETERDRT